MLRACEARARTFTGEVVQVENFLIGIFAVFVFGLWLLAMIAVGRIK